MKFSGKVGFWEEDVEVEPDIYRPKVIERPYTGDVINPVRKNQDGNNANDEFVITNRISILADLYMRKNFPSIKYVLWNGIKLKVKSVSIGYPRVTLDIGGVYNGEDAQEPEQSFEGDLS